VPLVSHGNKPNRKAINRGLNTTLTPENAGTVENFEGKGWWCLRPHTMSSPSLSAHPDVGHPVELQIGIDPLTNVRFCEDTYMLFTLNVLRHPNAFSVFSVVSSGAKRA